MKRSISFWIIIICDIYLSVYFLLGAFGVVTPSIYLISMVLSGVMSDKLFKEILNK